MQFARSALPSPLDLRSAATPRREGREGRFGTESPATANPLPLAGEGGFSALAEGRERGMIHTPALV
jgi:hypothetical protein